VLEQNARCLLNARVSTAIKMFPIYAEKVKSYCGRLPQESESPKIKDLPMWTREDQRRLSTVPGNQPVVGSFLHSTGGSSGVPVRFYVTRESYEWRMAVSDRGYSWAGAEEGRRSFYVWGAPIRPEGRLQRAKKTVHHWLQGRTYFDSFDFSDARKEECCRRINACRPAAIVGYAGNLVELARFARAHRSCLAWRAKTIVTAAEGLLPGQRELLQEYLGGEVFRSYGTREFMLIGMECSKHCGYHVASDNLLVEVVDREGNPAASGETGRILITDLHNAANPFIRYEVGDYGRLAPEPCPCGLPFPLLADVEGRVQEVIHTPDGGQLTALFVPHLMKEFSQVEGYQLVQDDSKHLVVNLIVKQDLADEARVQLLASLRERLGENMNIELKRVVSLEKNRTGKIPIVISRIQ